MVLSGSSPRAAVVSTYRPPPASAAAFALPALLLAKGKKNPMRKKFKCVLITSWLPGIKKGEYR
jgi:hypothetical protein